MGKLRRYSDLQMKVFRFYRQLLKFSVSKEEPAKSKLYEHIQQNFHQNAKNTSKFNTRRIEYLLRQGENQFVYLKDSPIDDINIM